MPSLCRINPSTSPTPPAGADKTWPPLAQLKGIVAPDRPELVTQWAATHGENATVVAPWAAICAEDSVFSATDTSGSSLHVWGSMVGRAGATGSFYGPDGARRLLESYSVSGLNAFDGINGLAAVVIWDAPNQVLRLLRHPGGAPRLMYRVGRDSTLWATRLEDIAQPNDVPDQTSWVNVLRFGSLVPPRTMFDSIKSVHPGHVMTFSSRAVVDEYFWPPRWPKRDRVAPPEVIVNQIDHLLSESIGSWQSTSQARPALLMSGGIDSAGLAAAMHRLGIDFTAYTVTFEDDFGIIDEFAEARRVTDHLGVEHLPITYRASFIADHLDWMVAHYESPFAYAAHTADLTSIASNGHEFVFGGTGPDTWYPSAAEDRWGQMHNLFSPSVASSMTRITKPLSRIRGVAGFHKSLDRRARGPLETVLDGLGPSMTQAQLSAILSAPDLANSAYDETRSTLAKFFEGQTLDDTLSVRSFGWPFFAYAERGIFWMVRWPEAYGLRSALPYVDRRLPTLLAGLKSQGRDRYEFRELASRSLPRDLAYNRKIGQSLPLATWFRGPLRDLLYDRVIARDAFDGFLRNDVVSTYVHEHMSGQADHQWLLWKLLTLSAWNSRAKTLTS